MTEPEEIDGYVGVENGKPIFRTVGDERGDDCKEISVYKTADDALNRFFNVRRVRLVVDPEPIRHPESWGSIDD